ncbi:MAG: cytochrome c [Proteobacteria bacterium]|nr:cytochrome c [Pseudomonadota bacterium]
MTCADGKNCDEPIKRRRALAMFGLMVGVFAMLSGFSFLVDRGQVTPDQVHFGRYQATAGKRVFQAYNCMDCHTIVGNGAYLAPDLTEEYKQVGPAWLAAFLPSAGGWPTEGALRAQLLDKTIATDAGVDTLAAYYEKFPGAKNRVERRGGGTSFMPNLPFHADEVGELIAYLKYTSEMNTEGWPPKVETGDLQHRLALLHGTKVASTAPVAAPAPAASASAATPDPIAHGEALAKDNGCTACHAIDGPHLVGPDWGGLYGAKVKLTNGSTVTADDAYLIESIVKPNAKIVAGFTPDVMPQQYGQMLKDDDVKDIVAYIHSLEKR